MNNTGTSLVVGSGPSGMAAAEALLRRGQRVTMVDYGLTLEEDRVRLVEKMGRQAPHEWSPEEVALLKANNEAEITAIPKKHIYGSDFPYREADFIRADLTQVEAKGSLGQGGFSNIWGGAMLPYLAGDIQAWPFGVDELAAHYRQVLEMTGLAAASDELEELFPLYHSDPQPLKPSRQTSDLLTHLTKNRDRLKEEGFHYGRPRLAVQAKACVYCGLCLHGCPYRLIYSTGQTMAKLLRHPQFVYKPNLFVQKVSETNGEVTLECRSRGSGEQVTIKGERAYLGLGALATARLWLESNQLYDREFSMMDSQYFLLPFYLSHGVEGVATESLHTLSQLFVELIDEQVSARTVHLQLYTYNDHFSMVFNRMGKLFNLMARPMTSAFLGHLAVFQGYLHSDDSARMKVRLVKDGDKSKLDVSPAPSDRPAAVYKKVLNKLSRHARLLGGRPLGPLASLRTIGYGNHIGGLLPMRNQPGATESDIWGRPHGWKRIHVVDSAVFPSIPATTITLNIMANAHRIASHDPSRDNA